MENKFNWTEFYSLVAGARTALDSGDLNDWQASNASMFAVLGSAMMDINDRLTTNQPVVDASASSPQIILGE